MTIIRVVDDALAQQYLEKVGLTLGEWHRIEYSIDAPPLAVNWDNLKAPSDAAQLLVFSQRILDWLPDSDGYVAAFDDSTFLDEAQLLVLQSIMGIDLRSAATSSGAVVISFQGRDLEAKVRISFLIFFCLIFCTHLYVVNAKSFEGPILRIVDGFSYFIGRHKSDAEIKAFIETLQKDVTTSPHWIVEYSASTYA
jgi:hypothetical protein